MASAIKELNYRIKGTERFWSKGGGEFVLQLKSDGLSSSDPLSTFWKHGKRIAPAFMAASLNASPQHPQSLPKSEIANPVAHSGVPVPKPVVFAY